jgi:hypothetical protein
VAEDAARADSRDELVPLVLRWGWSGVVTLPMVGVAAAAGALAGPAPPSGARPQVSQ